jgi:arginase
VVLAHKNVHLIGYASGVAASQAGCSDGPFALKDSVFLEKLAADGLKLHWDTIIEPSGDAESPILSTVTNDCTKLAEAVASAIQQKHFFTVIGGDHSCAIGTWSGVYDRVSQDGELGLIWVDAHMDSHTPDTSMTGNIHGMPLACLLGHGNTDLTSILNSAPKVNARNICIIGARSYEPGEEALIKKLNVRVFFMDEINERGLDAVMQEAVQLVTKHTAAFGITIDIDSVDPLDAPGTGVSEPDGIAGSDLCHAVRLLANHPRLIGAEIVEFDPHMDKDKKTEKLVVDLLEALTC